MTKFQEIYYNFFTRLYKFKNRIHLKPIDFEKPWWTIIWQQKWTMLMITSSLGAMNLYDSVIMVWIAEALQAQDLNKLILIIGVRVLMILVLAFVLNFNAIVQLTSMNSVFYSANQKLLETDPIHHSTKASGIIISKVNKGSAAYEDIQDVFIFEIFAILTTTAGTIILLLSYNLQIGLVATFMVILMALMSIYLNIYSNKVFKPICIEAEDKVMQTSTEILQQTSYIRSVFGTQSQLNELNVNILDQSSKEATRWEVDGLGYYIVRISFFVSVLVISIMIMDQIKSGQISTAIGISLITSYFISSGSIRSIGSQIKRLTASHSRITDLYAFMRGFGEQSFPVLDEKSKIK